MNQKQLPFGLLFANVDMRTQGFVAPPVNANYNPILQRSSLEKFCMGDTGTWGSSTTFYDSSGNPNGSDEDAMRDD
jgi:hypothetical protein